MDYSKIVVIIPYRGIGDLIFHIPLLEGVSLFYKTKIKILTNSSNKGKNLLKNLKFIDDIEYLDFTRERLIKNSLEIYRKINSIEPDLCILTAPSKRLVWPLKFTFIKKKIFFKKDNIKDISKYILVQSQKAFKKIKFKKKYNLNLSKSKVDRLNIFLNIDSAHNQNNWEEKYFIELIFKLLKKKKINTIFVNFLPTNKIYFKHVSRLFKKSKKIIFTHKFQFNKIINTINHCKYIVGNESGPNCIGAALNKKVISLYNPNYTPYVSSKIINSKNFYFNTQKNSHSNIINKIVNIIR